MAGVRLNRTLRERWDAFADALSAQGHTRRFRRGLAFATAGAVVLMGVALATWNVSDPSINHVTDAEPRNWLGHQGAAFADMAMQLIGVASLALLLVPLEWARRWFKGAVVPRLSARAITLVLALPLAAAVLAHLPAPASWPLPTGLGGVLGDMVRGALAGLLATLALPGVFAGVVALVLAGLLLRHASAVQVPLDAARPQPRAKPEPQFEEAPTHRATVHMPDDTMAEDEAEPRAGAFTLLAGGAAHLAYSLRGLARRAVTPAPVEPDIAPAYAAPEADAQDALDAARREPAFGAAPAYGDPLQTPSVSAALAHNELVSADTRPQDHMPIHAAVPAPVPAPAPMPTHPHNHAPAPAYAPANPHAQPGMAAPAPAYDPATGYAYAAPMPVDPHNAHLHAHPQAAPHHPAPHAAPHPGVHPGHYAQPPHAAHPGMPQPAAPGVAYDPNAPAPHHQPAMAQPAPQPAPVQPAPMAQAAPPAPVEEAPAAPVREYDQTRPRDFETIAFDDPEEDDDALAPLPEPVRAPQPVAQAPVPTPKPRLVEPRAYEDPPLGLLSLPTTQTQDPEMSREALGDNAQMLEGVLDDFGIKGEIVDVRPGPVVTLYELQPAPGIKSSRVIGLADDIARSMSAISARVAVVPGRNAIGIELPNRNRQTVYLREILEADAFGQSKARLPMCLGKTIGGEPVVADLARMPHLLIAGTTGSGKSVAVNTMILSLLYRLNPEQCRLIMIDPKMLELSVYDGIPHLLSPVVTDPKKAIVALKWTVREMEERYRAMSKLGVRNIDGFNTRVREAAQRGEAITRTVQTGFDPETGEPVFETEEMELKALPMIVVIVDEMADLMMVAGKEIEGAIQRLAQMARAAGIHLIMATQRPSTDVITGVVKANFPTRISFQVTSKIDSRVVLGEQGAEQLLGQGDMLYMKGGGRISRVHGPFVDDKEVEDVVNHLKSFGAPDYLDEVTMDEEEMAAASNGPLLPGATGDPDDPYDQALGVILRDGKASTSYIQRRLGIGYNRAASIIEKMEKEGIVGPANHAGKREILIDRAA